MLAQRLARLKGSSEWFRGGVVAYSSDVKHSLLRVPEGPVVSEAAVLAMARGVAQLMDAQLTVGVSGAGGPEPQDGASPGTVWMAVNHDGTTVASVLHLEGDPEEVCDSACRAAVAALVATLKSGVAAVG
jgi:nicotinamide-nucleotide amidase